MLYRSRKPFKANTKSSARLDFHPLLADPVKILDLLLRLGALGALGALLLMPLLWSPEPVVAPQHQHPAKSAEVGKQLPSPVPSHEAM